MRPNFLTCKTATQCKYLPFWLDGRITWDCLCKTPIKVHCSLHPNFTPYFVRLPQPSPTILSLPQFLERVFSRCDFWVVRVGSDKWKSKRVRKSIPLTWYSSYMFKYLLIMPFHTQKPSWSPQLLILYKFLFWTIMVYIT